MKYNVIPNGLIVSKATIKKNPEKLYQFQKIEIALDDLLANRPSTRDIVMYTSRQGMEQFNRAVEQQLNTVVGNVEALPNYIGGFDPISERPSQGVELPFNLRGEEIENSHSVTITESMTEEQLLNYLDQIS